MAPPIALEGATDTTAIQLPDPLTLNDVEALRTKQGKLVAGIAAKADIELFKGKGRHAHKPKAMRWDHRITKEAASRKGSRLKSAAQYLAKPGLISLGGGLPSSETFPFEQYSLTVPKPGQYSAAETRNDAHVIVAGKHDQAENKSLFDISTAFNYGQGSGSPQIMRWCVEHTELVHNPKYSDWSCTSTIGATSGVDMLLRMFGQRDTYWITEEYTFSSSVETAASQGVKSVGIAMDDEGMQADALDRVLTNWNPDERGGSPKPFLVYTVPSGQNPTGATQSLQRRKEIYAVAQKHDLLLIEDEPYYFLQMQTYVGQDAAPLPPPKTHSEFLSNLVPSLLSLDTDGRVCRLDSFSKVLSPGLREGWITAPTQIIERYILHTDQSTQSPSGFSQLALYKLLDEYWGHAGYLDWLIHLRLEYTSRRNSLLGACERHLPRDVVKWKPPMAGMFHWLQIDWKKHPQASELSVEEIEERIFMKSIEYGSLLIKGSWFMVEKGEKTAGEQDQGLFFRATYAAAPADKIDDALKRFGDAIRDEFKLETNGNANGANGHS